jgi:hypothetical protein
MGCRYVAGGGSTTERRHRAKRPRLIALLDRHTPDAELAAADDRDNVGGWLAINASGHAGLRHRRPKVPP